MKFKLCTFSVLLALATSSWAAVEGSDNAAAYGAGTWTNGSGTGNAAFSAWSIVGINGTGGGGAFIGDPSAGGMSGMPASSFGLYANPNGSGASVDVGRTFVGALSVGQTFSFDWSINYDSGIDGAKGFHILSGGVNGTSLVQINNAGNSDITLNGNNIGFGYGATAMTWSFTLLDANTLRVQANDRDGTGSLDQNVTIASAPDAFRLYAFQMQAPDPVTRDNAQPYFNNLSIVPEPSTMALALFGVLSAAVARRRLQK